MDCTARFCQQEVATVILETHINVPSVETLCYN